MVIAVPHETSAGLVEYKGQSPPKMQSDETTFREMCRKEWVSVSKDLNGMQIPSTGELVPP
jgi:hypothetical protein